MWKCHFHPGSPWRSHSLSPRWPKDLTFQSVVCVFYDIVYIIHKKCKEVQHLDNNTGGMLRKVIAPPPPTKRVYTMYTSMAHIQPGPT